MTGILRNNRVILINLQFEDVKSKGVGAKYLIFRTGDQRDRR